MFLSSSVVKGRTKKYLRDRIEEYQQLLCQNKSFHQFNDLLNLFIFLKY